VTEGFGPTLRLFRLRAGYSQNALAKIVCLNASYVNRLESGEREAPTREATAAMCRGLNLGVEDADRLMFSAGHVPPSLQKLGPADSTIVAVTRLLTNDRLGPEARADLRACIEAMCARWAENGIERPAPPLLVAFEAAIEALPRIVCLCGSTRFGDAYQAAFRRLSLAGEIVLTVAVVTYEGSGDPLRADPDQKRALDILHLRKIDLCDYVYVINPSGYIGESTRREIDYAVSVGKPVKYLEEGRCSEMRRWPHRDGDQ